MFFFNFKNKKTKIAMAQQMARAVVSQGGRVLSVLEKAKLVCWFEETHSFAQVARRYRAEFGVEPPQMEQVKKLHQRFLNTGSILNGTSQQKPMVQAVAAPTAPLTEFAGFDDAICQLDQPTVQQQLTVVSDAGGLDAEEQLIMARI